MTAPPPQPTRNPPTVTTLSSDTDPPVPSPDSHASVNPTHLSHLGCVDDWADLLFRGVQRRLHAEYLTQDPSFTLTQAWDVCRELYKCLVVMHRLPHASCATMPYLVYIAWREAILDTRAYTKFCHDRFNQYIHHSPALPLDLTHRLHRQQQRKQSPNLEQEQRSHTQSSTNATSAATPSTCPLQLELGVMIGAYTILWGHDPPMDVWLLGNTHVLREDKLRKDPPQNSANKDHEPAHTATNPTDQKTNAHVTNVDGSYDTQSKSMIEDADENPPVVRPIHDQPSRSPSTSPKRRRLRRLSEIYDTTLPARKVPVKLRIGREERQRVNSQQGLAHSQTQQKLQQLPPSLSPQQLQPTQPQLQPQSLPQQLQLSQLQAFELESKQCQAQRYELATVVLDADENFL